MITFRKAASVLYRSLELMALASGPAVALFGFLAWQEAKSASANLTAAARATATLVRLFSAAAGDGNGRADRAAPVILTSLRSAIDE